MLAALREAENEPFIGLSLNLMEFYERQFFLKIAD
jgi:hypothetical protein